MRCDECKFWKPNDGEVGECRRFPPLLDKKLYSDAELGGIDEGYFGWYVRTDGSDWCGEFQAKENAEKVCVGATKINFALETLGELTVEEIRDRLQSLETESRTLRSLLRSRLIADSPNKRPSK